MSDVFTETTHCNHRSAGPLPAASLETRGFPGEEGAKMRKLGNGSAASWTRSTRMKWRGVGLILLLIALGQGPASASAGAANLAPKQSKELVQEEAEVSAEVAAALVAVDVAERAVADEAPAPPAQAVRADRFFEHRDAPIRRALSRGDVAEVRRGHGGRSLSFRVTLDDGTEGYFKPAQSFNGMNWTAEIAAYHLDRELGFGRTAPSVARALPHDALAAVASSDARVDELRPGADGTIEGAFIWWVPERLRPVALPDGWERWLLIEGEPPEVSPFQRPGAYRRARAAGRTRTVPAAPEPDVADRPAEMSDLIVFDYLSHNLDRWGGNNTNIRTVGEGGPLMFLDNAAAFTLGRARIPLMDRRLRQVQRFRRSTVDAVRSLDVDAYQARLAEDPLAPTLDPRQLRNLEARRQFLLAHVDALVERHGEEAVYVW